MEPKSNPILERTAAFALNLIKILTKLPRNPANSILVKQAIRSGTSIGANAEEAVGASSKKEFTHCMTIARKETRETRYWLRLILAINSDFREDIVRVGSEVTELLKILNQIIKTSRTNP